MTKVDRGKGGERGGEKNDIDAGSVQRRRVHSSNRFEERDASKRRERK